MYVVITAELTVLTYVVISVQQEVHELDQGPAAV